MTTTATPQRVVVDFVAPIESGDFDSGFGDVTITEVPALDALDDYHPALFAWDRLMDEARAEVAPEVARLLNEAINRRLPWTWEGDKPPVIAAD
jgi:hypothetical protein